MSDVLIARIKAEIVQQVNRDWANGEVAAAVLRDAAAEIERLTAELDKVTAAYSKRGESIEELGSECEQLHRLVTRWVADTDAGNLDGVDLELMVASEEAVSPTKTIKVRCNP